MGDTKSTRERLSTLETKSDRILEEISTIRGSFLKIEKSLCAHTKDIERIKVELNFIKVIATWIFAPLLGTIGMGVVLAVFYALKMR